MREVSGNARMLLENYEREHVKEALRHAASTLRTRELLAMIEREWKQAIGRVMGLLEGNG